MSIVIGPSQLKVLKILARNGGWMGSHSITKEYNGYYCNGVQNILAKKLYRLKDKGLVDHKKAPGTDIRGCIRYLNYWRFIKFPPEIQNVCCKLPGIHQQTKEIPQNPFSNFS